MRSIGVRGYALMSLDGNPSSGHSVATFSLWEKVSRLEQRALQPRSNHAVYWR